MHTSRNGRGLWKSGSISIGLIHHGNWCCLCKGAVGFVLAKYYGRCMWVTKLLGQNYCFSKYCTG